MHSVCVVTFGISLRPALVDPRSQARQGACRLLSCYFGWWECICMVFMILLQGDGVCAAFSQSNKSVVLHVWMLEWALACIYTLHNGICCARERPAVGFLRFLG